jgi:hypothetical protein
MNDKVMHVILGVISCCASYLGIVIFKAWGLGPLLAYSSTIVGFGYEAQQYIRKEGTVDALDALATAAPGWILGVLIYVLK